MINSYNNTIACEPFATNEITADKSKYYASVDSNNAVEGLKVVYGNDQIKAGSIVYVLTAHKNSAWALNPNTVTFRGQKLIFVPIADIKMVEDFSDHITSKLPVSSSMPVELMRFK